MYLIIMNSSKYARLSYLSTLIFSISSIFPPNVLISARFKTRASLETQPEVVELFWRLCLIEVISSVNLISTANFLINSIGSRRKTAPRSLYRIFQLLQFSPRSVTIFLVDGRKIAAQTAQPFAQARRRSTLVGFLWFFLVRLSLAVVPFHVSINRCFSC